MAENGSRCSTAWSQASLLGFAVGWVVCKAVTLILPHGMDRRRTNGFFTYAQIVGAAAMSFMHGAQDGQKFIGVLFLGMAFCNGQTQRDRCDDSDLAHDSVQHHHGRGHVRRR